MSAEGSNPGGEPKRQLIMSGMIRLEASSACQLRCPSCPTTTGHTSPVVGKSVLKLADFVKLVDENPWVGRIELSNYGEIFLNRDLLGIFRHAYERNVKLHVSNGANLNHVRNEVLEGLVRYQIESLNCSIDGASQETYGRYRVRGKYERVIGNIRRINEFKKIYGTDLPRLQWQFIAFGHNEHEIETARQLAAELGMNFYVKLNWDAAFSPVEDLDSIRTATKTGAATRAEFRERYGAEYLEGTCDQLWSGPQINWDGKVLGCCRNFWGEFGGNALRDGLSNVLNSEKLSYAREMLEGSKPARSDIPCSTCELYTRRKDSKRWFNPRPRVRVDTTPMEEAWARARAAQLEGHLGKAAAWARILLQLKADHAGALDMLGLAAEAGGRAEAARYFRAKAALVERSPA